MGNIKSFSFDPKAVTTPYERKHNHNIVAVKLLTGASVSASHHHNQSDEGDILSLDLGMGISSRYDSCIK